MRAKAGDDFIKVKTSDGYLKSLLDSDRVSVNHTAKAGQSV